MKILPPLLVSIFLLNGCTVGPDYVRPTVETTETFKEAKNWKNAQPGDHLPKGQWWTIFNDPALNELEAQVDVSSQRLRMAEAQFRQARAVAQGARAGWFPSLSGSVSASRGKTATAKAPTTTHNLGLDASWEADIWGRVGRTVEAGDADAQASRADLESARLSIQTDLAQNYFLLRVTDMQIRLLNKTLAGYERSLQIVNNQYAAGVASRAEIALAETQLKSTRVQALDLGVQRTQLEHAIALLIGKPPGSFSLANAETLPTLPSIPLGVPSDLLERRPDIAAAERRIAAANARIGVAKSALFPSLTLSAATGYQSASYSHWLTTPNRFWSLGPALAMALLDGGLRQAQNEQALATYDQSVASYRQTVLASFQEVEDQLAALAILDQEASVQDEAVKAARDSVNYTNNQYKAGTVAFLSVVNVESTALANERTALSIMGRRLAASVSLVKALGGGWDGKTASQ